MDQLGRKQLPHEPPIGIGVGGQLFFLTICAKERCSPVLLEGIRPQVLLESIRHRHERGVWFVKVMVVMPDHVHALLRLPEEGSLRHSVEAWKRWTARQGGVEWQRDFFDHRLRSDESESEKADYILMNSVRARLCATPSDWPHFWIAR
jgi:putative transposase